jgi:putative transposase
MSRFRKLSQTLWHCQYHIVWTPKYRYRIISGKLATDVENCVRAFSEKLRCEIDELNVQVDHVHLLVMIPPKISVSQYTGTIKGRTAIRILNKYGSSPI